MTPHPTVPDPLDPETFAARMDAYIAWMATNADELQAFASGYLLSLTTSSVSSVAIGTGAKTFTVAAGLGYVAGMELIVAYTTDPADHSMTGTVTSYSGTTLIVEVTSIRGSGTYAVWSISPTATADFDGQVFTDLVLSGQITETPYALSGTDIDPANGTIQSKTLSGNTTFTSSIADGQSVTLHITKGAYTITWPTMDWLYGDPTLSSSSVSVVIMWKVGSTLCGCYAGPLQ
jgi:hypothetical protein